MAFIHYQARLELKTTSVIKSESNLLENPVEGNRRQMWASNNNLWMRFLKRPKQELKLALPIKAMYMVVGLGVFTGFLTIFLYPCLRPFFITNSRKPNDWRVVPGRQAPVGKPDMAIFLIGMRINHFYRIDLWVKSILAMSAMMKELNEAPEKFGYYGGVTYGLLALLFGYPSIQVQYWESTEKVIEYATNKTHSNSIALYIKAMRDAGPAVGVWHELYQVKSAEGIHRNMPPFGMVDALSSVPATGKMDSSKTRLDQWVKKTG